MVFNENLDLVIGIFKRKIITKNGNFYSNPYYDKIKFIWCILKTNNCYLKFHKIFILINNNNKKNKNLLTLLLSYLYIYTYLTFSVVFSVFLSFKNLFTRSKIFIVS